MVKFSFLLVLFVSLKCHAAITQEPTFLSRYDYDFKMLKKVVDLEKSNEELRTTISQQAVQIAKLNSLGR